jgi:hypothetical protein
LEVGPQTTNPWTLAPQTIKKFKKNLFYRNMLIIPLPRVIFQLKKKFKIYIYILKEKKNMGVADHTILAKGWPKAGLGVIELPPWPLGGGSAKP